MSINAAIEIGPLGGDRVVLSVLGRPYATSREPWEREWLDAALDLSIGAFRAELAGMLRTDELTSFREGLERVHESLSEASPSDFRSRPSRRVIFSFLERFGGKQRPQPPEAVLTSIEKWISLRVTCDAGGQLAVEGDVSDGPARWNRLTFTIDGLDQTWLPPIIERLKRVESALPDLGDL